LAAPFTAKDRQPTPEELVGMPAVASPEKAASLLREVRVPEGFEASIFATPPAVNYPVFVAAAPDGTVYVSSDGNGSLDRKPHLGRVLRVRDTNGDGQADEVRALVPDIDSPRGLVWDHDRLYVLHPPDISVFFDRDGDGVAEERKTLVKGIAFTFKDRPADHSSNGLELGVDGWLYAAIGDFGFMEAVGTDGKKLQLRGGGVVRVRPDGSGLEVWADGTRNILEVAVSPLLDGFARDNTNDGGGWDVRLHHFSGMTQHGYPRLFKNFGDEIIPPLADYGGGSGCGGGWVDEPGLPAEWNNAPFTADWGREWVYQHSLTPKGATFTAGQKEFLRLPRVTDVDVDAHSAIYGASWKGASFTWVGPEVGFLVRVTPKGYKSPALPRYSELGESALVAELASPSHRRRLEAQRALVRKGVTGEGSKALSQFAADPARLLSSRIAAVFALKLAGGVASHSTLLPLLKDPSIAPWVLRALGDHPTHAHEVPLAPVTPTLASTDPRTRKEALITLARMGRVEAAASMIPLLADPDPIVAHTAVHALSALKAVPAVFAALDASGTPAAVRRGLGRVLQSWHEGPVVDGLIERLGKETDATRRQGLLTTLCRLYHVDGPWKGDSWGTRPDTRGPYYQPEEWDASPRILAALQATVESAGAAEAAFVGSELSRHRIQSGSALRKLIQLAEQDPALLPAVAAQLATADSIPPAAIAPLARAATADSIPDAARAQAVQALTRSDSAEGWRAVVNGLPRVLATKTENHQAEKTRSAFLNASQLDSRHEVFASEAARLAGEPSVWADVALLKIAGRKTASPENKASASKALDEGWAVARRRVQIMKAAGIAGDASRAAQFVAALEDTDADVADAARKAVKQLKIDPARFAAEAKELKVGDLTVERALAAAFETKGDSARGEQLFGQVGCNGCHTVKTDEPLKGPFLGHIAKTYRRRELAEAILIPGKTLAQGFVTHHFELKDGSEVDGFVVQEAADAVTIRTIAAAEQKIPLGEIVKREKQERSLMPEGLVAGLTVREFASILDYLEALAKSAP
jgi:putative membrane-bound dehydrogenase-like protein